MFILSGVPKLLTMREFAAAMSGYELVGSHVATLLAITLPWLEIGVGGLLVFEVCTAGALVVAILLLTSFSTAIAFALLRHLDIECGCFGVGENSSQINTWTLLRAILLLSIVTWLYFRLLLPGFQSPSGLDPSALPDAVR
jgi:hypothetical protein